MKLLSRFNVSQDKGGPRKFSFEISLSGVISVGIVVVLGMCWVFILGILVGRGYKPEAAVPQIAQMMPTTEIKQPEGTTNSAPPTVLKPEELQFMEGLHEGKDGEVVADSTQKSPADGRKAGDPKAAPMGAAPAAMAIPPQPKPAAGAIPPAPPKPAVVPAAPSRASVEPKAPFEKKEAGKYVATYQVAAFPSKEQAETMVKNLSRKGLAASIQEGTSNNRAVFRVKVQLKGSEAEIAQGLKRTGEKGPILLGKKPL
ncbi:SPOR domain-containing protein [Solidesulfovibrio sp.]|uniref:SPOR domain-containing protein n=1 Tax=Solidesulfovibrio sp. TaxID=2910990 RepID=UPI002B214737|nr:SPOR domain-containing protein [Solidesulfovibrio sp.]MEA4857363.1 SPOR domain-containing protein [Solidesulfovibrio sp.]